METMADLIGRRFALETKAGYEMPAEGTLAAILNHRSQRRYLEDPVPDSLLAVLLACAQSAPTKSNLQQYSIIVVDSSKMRRLMAPLCPDTDWIETCPVFLVFCANVRRNRRIAEFRGHEYANDNMDTFMNAVIDAALAMQCFITAAESEGLGCAPISEVRNRIAEVSEVLELPHGVFPISGLTAGWPAAEGYVNQRLPGSAVVHLNTYDEFELEAVIDDYDKRRHAIFPVPPAKQRHSDKYGILEFCGWSENVARQLSLPERAGFRDFLKSHGFDLA
jgi:nitroreductase/FMN reductase [NAD(P)H]